MCLAIALVIPATVSAHITIAPPFVEDGVESTISFETPNERPPQATTTISVTAPPGIEVVSATAPAGWQELVNGSTVTWSGGRLEDRAAVSFSMRVRAAVRAGTYAFRAVQTYDDGATVNWNAALSVLPASGSAAPKQHPWGAVAAALAGVAVIFGSLLVVRFLRRRSLQEQ
jgi:uncharacterized protein YcnI